MEHSGTAPIVMKFGGTSVEDAAAFERVGRIVRAQDDAKLVLVVSAMSRVTDALLAGIQAAVDGEIEAGRGAIDGDLQRYQQVAQMLLSRNAAGLFGFELDEARSAIADLLQVIAAHPVTRAPLQDEVLSYGERLSAKLLAASLAEGGTRAQCVDARRCIATDEEHGCATPLFAGTTKNTQVELRPLIQEGTVPVLGGFIGKSPRGATTTLGRGGSDYTAALVGAALAAREIMIWTDVSGVLTADPRVVGTARAISHLSYAEAAELAYFGAKVLHPKTIQPAVESGIPLRICNSRDPEGPGTLVSHAAQTAPQTVKAIAHKKGITVVQITSARMLGAYGFLRSLFKVFDQHRTVVDVVTTSEVSVSLSLDDTGALPALIPELERLGSVQVETRRAIVCVVGEGLRAAPGIAARVFGTLSDINISMISQGASSINLTFVVDEDRADEAVSRLHEEFFENVMADSGASLEFTAPRGASSQRGQRSVISGQDDTQRRDDRRRAQDDRQQSSAGKPGVSRW